MRSFILLWPMVLAFLETYECRSHGSRVAPPLSRDRQTTEYRSGFGSAKSSPGHRKWWWRKKAAANTVSASDVWSEFATRVKGRYYDDENDRNSRLQLYDRQTLPDTENKPRDLRNFFLTSGNLRRRKRLDLMGVGNMDYTAASFDKASQRSSAEVIASKSPLTPHPGAEGPPVVAVVADVDDVEQERRDDADRSFNWMPGGVSKFRDLRKPVSLDQLRFMMEKLRVAG